MPFREHSAFDTPEDAAKLWRYHDLPKFLSLISTSSLYFSRADLLGDKWEGAIPPQHAAALAEMCAGVRTPEQTLEDVRGFSVHSSLVTFVSCWHRNDSGESDGMWKAYASGGAVGVAVQTDVASFKAALGAGSLVFLGEVHYRDYSRDLLVEKRGLGFNAFSPCLNKRRAFEHEKEVRAICMPASRAKANEPITAESMPAGVMVQVDLNRLIKSLYLAPGCSAWAGDAIRAVTAKFGVSAPVLRSELDAPRP